MSEAPLMLGVSGLRGIVGQSLTPEVAVKYAGVFGTWLWERSPGARVVVGRDGRAGGEAIYELVIGALLSSGCSVIPVGVAMTPTVGVAVDEHLADAGVIITASHNPGEWNGIKLLLRRIEDAPDVDSDIAAYRVWHEMNMACAPSQASAEDIIHHFKSYRVPWKPVAKVPGSQVFNSKHTVIGAHTYKVWERVVIGMRHEHDDNHRERPIDPYATALRECKKWRVVLDSVNSSGSEAAGQMIRSFHAEAVQLFGDNSGIFPHTPEPTAENLSGEGGLCDAVPGLKADVGFAQDPDGDRLAIVDEQGKYIGEEYTLVLAAMSILEARKSRGREHAEGDEEDGALTPALSRGAREREAEKTPHPGPLPEGEREEDVVICVNLSTSRMIDDVAARYGARVVRTAVGEANVVEAMKKLKREGKNVILGGEGNGGVIWPEVTYVRDSLGAMALTLSLMARTGKTVSELVADVPSYAIVKRKQPLAKKEDARPTVERLAAHYAKMGEGVRVDTLDGVRIDFDADRAWVHVRASNTEPILRLIGEAPTRERAEAVLDEVQRLVSI